MVAYEYTNEELEEIRNKITYWSNRPFMSPNVDYVAETDKPYMFTGSRIEGMKYDGVPLNVRKRLIRCPPCLHYTTRDGDMIRVFSASRAIKISASDHRVSIVDFDEQRLIPVKLWTNKQLNVIKMISGVIDEIFNDIYSDASWVKKCEKYADENTAIADNNYYNVLNDE